MSILRNRTIQLPVCRTMLRMSGWKLFLVCVASLLVYLLYSSWFSVSQKSRLISTTEQWIPAVITEPPDMPEVLPSMPPTESQVLCAIPKMDPMDPSIREFIFTPEPVSCGNASLFTSEMDQLIFHRDRLREYGISSEDYSCCYQELSRIQSETKGKDADNLKKYSDNCIRLDSDVTTIEAEFIRITCRSDNDTMFYKDFQLFVPRKVAVEERIRNTNGTDGLSVLVIGSDAVSRLNMIRQMPETLKFLQDMGAIDMQGHHKVADNTFPNLIPVLAGLTEKELRKNCWHSITKSHFDTCPFIWKDFAGKGYRTVYGEDIGWMGVFTHNRRGFMVQPTDYYIRPVEMAMYDEIGHVGGLLSNLCYGPRLTMQMMLDYAEKVAKTFANDKHFTFLWCGGLTHDYVNYARLADPLVLNLLQNLRTRRALNQTALVFMSDHGIRYGDILKTYQGKLEGRLPFLYFVFPEWFLSKYNVAVENLRRNSKLLTSHFDLHETLLDLSDLSSLTPESIERRTKELSNPRGISMFLPIPTERNCFEAGIANHWCTCHTSKPIPIDDPRVNMSSHFVINSLNHMLSSHMKCAELRLSKALEAMEQFPINSELAAKQTNSHILLTIEAEPSGAILEATVIHHPDGQMKLGGEIGRNNLYRDQSWCVDDYVLKKYCYCV